MQGAAAPAQLAAALSSCLHQLMLDGSQLHTLLSIAGCVAAATAADRCVGGFRTVVVGTAWPLQTVQGFWARNIPILWK